ncbi:MAG TPA: ribosome biogenesis GTPase Der [bacterium]|nr:ribosome biogenesis GTPase Der [bacterium]
MLGTVTIIGRANVGKSTLFNRLSETRRALVSKIPGTTRDLKYAEVEWQGQEFKLVDTGGFLAEQKSELQKLTKKREKKMRLGAGEDIDRQVELKARQALEKSDLVILMTDAIEGLNPQDKKIANFLRQSKKLTIIAINKCDTARLREQTADFYQLGLGEPYLISAANGAGIGDLLEGIVTKLKSLKKKSIRQPKKETVRVAIIGKPNVGKSSLLNTLSGEEKVIVSATPHTTREPNDTKIDYQDKEIIIIDTAGVRRKARIDRNGLEESGVRMTWGVLRDADVAIVMIDINENLSHQDMQLGKIIAEAGVGTIIVANKYDLVRGREEEKSADEYRAYIQWAFPHLSYAPIVLASAKTGFNTEKILKLILEVSAGQKIKVTANALNKFLKFLIKKQPPVKKRINFRGRVAVKRAFVTRLRQVDIKPPVFECEVGSDEELEESYKKYIINNLREKFHFVGAPIRLVVRRLQKKT